MRRTYLLSQRALADPARRPAQPHLPARGRPPRHHARVRDLALPSARLRHRPDPPLPLSGERRRQAPLPRLGGRRRGRARRCGHARVPRACGRGAAACRRGGGCATAGERRTGRTSGGSATTGRRRCWRHGRMAACPTAMGRRTSETPQTSELSEISEVSRGGLCRRAARDRGRDRALRRRWSPACSTTPASTTSASPAAPRPSRRSPPRRTATRRRRAALRRPARRDHRPDRGPGDHLRPQRRDGGRRPARPTSSPSSTTATWARRPPARAGSATRAGTCWSPSTRPDAPAAYDAVDGGARRCRCARCCSTRGPSSSTRSATRARSPRSTCPTSTAGSPWRPGCSSSPTASSR